MSNAPSVALKCRRLSLFWASAVWTENAAAATRWQATAIDFQTHKWPTFFMAIEHTHISSRILHTPHLSKKPLGLTLNALSLLICHSLLSRFNSVPLFLSCFNMPVIQNRHRWAWDRNALGLFTILNLCNLRQLAYQRCYGDSVAESCLHFDDPLNFPVPTSCSLISILGKCDRSVTMCLQAHPRSSERESW